MDVQCAARPVAHRSGGRAGKAPGGGPGAAAARSRHAAGGICAHPGPGAAPAPATGQRPGAGRPDAAAPVRGEPGAQRAAVHAAWRRAAGCAPPRRALAGGGVGHRPRRCRRGARADLLALHPQCLGARGRRCRLRPGPGCGGALRRADGCAPGPGVAPGARLAVLAAAAACHVQRSGRCANARHRGAPGRPAGPLPGGGGRPAGGRRLAATAAGLGCAGALRGRWCRGTGLAGTGLHAAGHLL
ncbi:hypothetical protein D3C71_1127890 [compost metagenome]